MSDAGDQQWHKAAEPEELAEGGVKMCALAGRMVAVVCHEGRYAALDNRCPHMGGPLGQGSIEAGLLVCPWHGREFDPFTGECATTTETVETFPAEAREDGIYVALQKSEA